MLIPREAVMSKIWESVDLGKLPQGVRLTLKMADKDDRITYAIGIMEKEGLRYTALEDKNGTKAMYWTCLLEDL
jgi:hypothetical protein